MSSEQVDRLSDIELQFKYDIRVKYDSMDSRGYEELVKWDDVAPLLRRLAALEEQEAQEWDADYQMGELGEQRLPTITAEMGRLQEIRERAEYLKKYGERELYYYNPQEHKDLFFLLDRLEASQQEVERLADVIDDLIIHSWDDGSTKCIPKVEWESAINREMDLLKETWERMTDAALEEQEAQEFDQDYQMGELGEGT